MSQRYTHQISGFVHGNIDMSRAGIILDPAIRIVAEYRHAPGRFIHVWVSGNKLIVVVLKRFIKLRVRQQERHQREKNRRTVPLALMHHILRGRLRVLIIYACQHAAGRRVKHHEMIGIRTLGRFVFRHALVCIDLSDRTFTGPIHAVA